jgi:hypothetical protein
MTAGLEILKKFSRCCELVDRQPRLPSPGYGRCCVVLWVR